MDLENTFSIKTHLYITMKVEYLSNIIRVFGLYKQLGEKAMDQLTDEELLIKPGDAFNNIAIVVNHVAGNMLSRWTDFLTSDGEKSWRHRDTEFLEFNKSKEEIYARWNEGWDCLFNTLNSLRPEDLEKNVTIRNEQHNVVEALNRQLAHYAYHVGQIVFIANSIKGEGWKSLSIPRGQSEQFNAEMNSKHKNN